MNVKVIMEDVNRSVRTDLDPINVHVTYLVLVWTRIMQGGALVSEIVMLTTY